jgi:transposase InsO family protein
MYSRYLLGCDAHNSVSLRDTTNHFIELFDTFGLPKRIRSDNGVPFASSALARLSSLSVWWIKLGIYPELIEPGKPQQNGKHERMHRTLKKEATIPPKQNLKRQQEELDKFKAEYNEIRPHESLNMDTPADVYQPSKRRMPQKVGRYDYPSHFEVRAGLGKLDRSLSENAVPIC